MEVQITQQNNVSKVSDKKRKSRAAGVLDNRRTEGTPWKCFRCGSEYDLIAKFPKPPKENEKWRTQVGLAKNVIVHVTTAKIAVTKRYMHL